jgi:hypothetical protein
MTKAEKRDSFSRQGALISYLFYPFGAGKTTLVAKLQGNEDPKKGSGLEYSYIEIR